MHLRPNKKVLHFASLNCFPYFSRTENSFSSFFKNFAKTSPRASLFKVYLFKPIIKRVKFCKISPRRFSTCWIHLHLKPGLFFGTIFCTSGVTKFQARKCEFLLKFLYLKQLSLSWNCTFLLRALNFVIKMNGWSNALVAFTGFTGHSALGCL